MGQGGPRRGPEAGIGRFSIGARTPGSLRSRGLHERTRYWNLPQIRHSMGSMVFDRCENKDLDQSHEVCGK
jgi:hypothetical protein